MFRTIRCETRTGRLQRISVPQAANNTARRSGLTLDTFWTPCLPDYAITGARGCMFQTQFGRCQAVTQIQLPELLCFAGRTYSRGWFVGTGGGAGWGVPRNDSARIEEPSDWRPPVWGLVSSAAPFSPLGHGYLWWTDPFPQLSVPALIILWAVPCDDACANIRHRIDTLDERT